jgi:hypothetical protein
MFKSKREFVVRGRTNGSERGYPQQSPDNNPPILIDSRTFVNPKLKDAIKYAQEGIFEELETLLKKELPKNKWFEMAPEGETILIGLADK